MSESEKNLTILIEITEDKLNLYGNGGVLNHSWKISGCRFELYYCLLVELYYLITRFFVHFKGYCSNKLSEGE
ncbi:MAG: hypothetical protein DRG59_03630 [Deltaproteobacteria bacterium]|nr:MAG: hypothetical protein DRG59_03630 [Deltaproteobacteria bacterium]